MISRKHANRALPFSIAILCAFAHGAFAADWSAAHLQQTPVPQTSRKLSAEQLAEANARVKLANSIVQHVAHDAESMGLEPSWRVNLLGSLYHLTSFQLHRIEPDARTLQRARALINAANDAARSAGVVAKSLGDPLDDLVFVPLTPCRFIDTRQAGGAITTTRDFSLGNYGDYYGGSHSCYLPGTGEPSFAANATVVVAPGAAGYIGIRAYGSSNTTSFINWPTGGAPSGLANAGIVTAALDPDSDFEFEVSNGASSSAPQFILDFFGYFEPANYPTTALTCSEVVNSQTLPAGFNGSSIASLPCPSGQTAVSPYCYSSNNLGVYSTGSGVANGNSFCGWINSNSSAVTVSQGQHCCQIPSSQ